MFKVIQLIEKACKIKCKLLMAILDLKITSDRANKKAKPLVNEIAKMRFKPLSPMEPKLVRYE